MGSVPSANTTGSRMMRGSIIITVLDAKPFTSLGRNRKNRMRFRYFYDPEKKRFEEICLPSQLNRPRQRTKDRTQKQALVIPGEKAGLLPSVVSIE